VRQGAERGIQAPVVEDGGVDAAGQLAQLGDRRLGRVWASSISALAAAGSLSIFCWASPSVIPTDTSRGWTPSWRSRSMRVRSSSPERTALSLRAGGAGLLHEHRLTARHEDRAGEHRMQERSADQQREADDDAHDADRDGRLDADLHIRGGDARGILADQRCEQQHHARGQRRRSAAR
jgi:hypothetical protein